MTHDNAAQRLRVLHLILMLGETNGQYNEHCLPLIDVRDLSICTFFEPQLTPPDQIALFAGDGTIRGFFRAFRRALDTKEYDVVHCHAPQSGALAALALLSSLRLGRYRPSMVYTVQDSFYDYKLRDQALMVIALVAFKRIAFCSRAAYDSVPRPWKWLVRGRWRVVQNAADFDRIDHALASEAITRDESVFTVVSVGRLERVKDPATLVGAFDKGADGRSRLVLVGAGSLEPSVRARVAELDLEDRVEFTGLVPRDEVFVRCAAADVFVSTSHGEGLPVAVIEAMATQCPVILSDIPPHRELADGADFIPLIAVGDTDGFAREIRRFRHMSRTELRDLGLRSRDHVTARYTLQIMHAGIEALYRELPGLVGMTTRSP